MTIALSDKLSEASQLAHALQLAISGKLEQLTEEDKAIERLASAVRSKIEEAAAQFEVLRESDRELMRDYDL